jgi:acyl carrier protein
MKDIKQTVRAYIADNFMMGAHAATFADGDSFIEQHVIDSTGFLELVMFLEETYGVVVGDEEMVPENLDSLDNIAAYVSRKRAA